MVRVPINEWRAFFSRHKNRVNVFLLLLLLSFLHFLFFVSFLSSGRPPLIRVAALHFLTPGPPITVDIKTWTSDVIWKPSRAFFLRIQEFLPCRNPFALVLRMPDRKIVAGERPLERAPAKGVDSEAPAVALSLCRRSLLLIPRDRPWLAAAGEGAKTNASSEAARIRKEANSVSLKVLGAFSVFADA